jgi:hypothetical protein
MGTIQQWARRLGLSAQRTPSAACAAAGRGGRDAFVGAEYVRVRGDFAHTTPPSTGALADRSGATRAAAEGLGVIGAKDTGEVMHEFVEQAGGFGPVPGVADGERNMEAGVEGVRVVGAQGAGLVGGEFAEETGGLGPPAGLADVEGVPVAAAKRVGVIGPKDASLVGYEFGQHRGRDRWAPSLSDSHSLVVAALEPYTRSVWNNDRDRCGKKRLQLSREVFGREISRSHVEELVVAQAKELGARHQERKDRYAQFFGFVELSVDPADSSPAGVMTDITTVAAHNFCSMTRTHRSPVISSLSYQTATPLSSR